MRRVRRGILCGVVNRGLHCAASPCTVLLCVNLSPVHLSPSRQAARSCPREAQAVEARLGRNARPCHPPVRLRRAYSPRVLGRSALRAGRQAWRFLHVWCRCYHRVTVDLWFPDLHWYCCPPWRAVGCGAQCTPGEAAQENSLWACHLRPGGHAHPTRGTRHRW
ncbi:hypothetical protein VHUM_02255 [Vanrija humicola]|uniref:Uncharacterized protein n=1 Tax=Vanrija humicola TaxID=5417 RepID=A0A7D8V0H3_VANHU|nr:hypothetical protein VHUM_02255 [Vanrija humicola]